ncbi:MAG: hypothetical protein AVDCRST_MAG32-1906, partial [uncultured Nocardioides sp.]
ARDHPDDGPRRAGRHRGGGVRRLPAPRRAAAGRPAARRRDAQGRGRPADPRGCRLAPL